MYETGAQRWTLLAIVLVIVGLAAHSVWEVRSLADKPNPFDHPAVGVPALAEGPFDPTRGGIRPDLLPWTLDPASLWSEKERAAAATPTGLLETARGRYPLWREVMLDPDLAPDGAVVLERHKHFEMVVAADGLQVRRPPLAAPTGVPSGAPAPPAADVGLGEAERSDGDAAQADGGRP